jgi:hypothetical protein
MGVSISELIEEIGCENVSIQHIRNSIITVKQNKKNRDNEVTFCTNELTPTDFVTGDGKVGFVVWFTQEQADEAVKAVCLKKEGADK